MAPIPQSSRIITPPPLCSPEIARPPPPHSACTRRYSLALFAAAPILDAVANEARLWKQEAELYGRRSGDALGGLFPAKGLSSNSGGGVQAPLDAEFASALLAAVVSAAGSKAAAVKGEAAALEAKELPFFQNAGTCGHCGTVKGPSSLKDREYFDFKAYVLCKTLVRFSCGTSAVGAEASTACIDKLRLDIGDGILKHILSEIDVGEAEAVGITPFRAFSATSAALLSASPELDSIRAGVKALLKYFGRKGFVASSGISQFGLSADEYENHMVWARGEPAYLQYWLIRPADLRSTAALQAEDGACVGFVAAAVSAYLRRCGVECEGLRRVPSLSDPSQAAEQLTLRRVKPLQNGGRGWEKGEYKAWKPDACPNGAEIDCF